MDREVVGLRHIDSDETDAGLHQGGNDGDVAGQPVQLGDQEDATDAAGLFEGGFTLRAPAFAGSGFNFSELKRERQVFAAGVGEDGGLLGSCLAVETR
ncbi:hypothetical protein GCM10010840_36500 [Deinococcus aerolatus]|uniref:Uncharacterized protein n=1 Tax=Deinococcus aerolatus TaxID=522487 RepID=A0ABQ2GGF3_9DEIO|nr:hypothetical protein GCM10010840_36500 [Deinococcus aerolatus]